MSKTSPFIAAVCGAALVALAMTFGPAAVATHQPANTMSIAGSGVEVMGTPLAEGSSSEEVTLLSGRIRTSAPTDLIIRVTSECALWTDATTVGNDESQAVAALKVWVEIDGRPVPVAADDSGEDAGKVVFCNRAYKRVTSLFDDEDATIKTYLSTRTANAFNWISLNLGNGVHTVVVKGQLEAQVTGTGEAKAAVGKRTLVIEPARLGNDVSL